MEPSRCAPVRSDIETSGTGVGSLQLQSVYIYDYFIFHATLPRQPPSSLRHDEVGRYQASIISARRPSFVRANSLAGAMRSLEILQSPSAQELGWRTARVLPRRSLPCWRWPPVHARRALGRPSKEGEVVSALGCLFLEAEGCILVLAVDQGHIHAGYPKEAVGDILYPRCSSRMPMTFSFRPVWSVTVWGLRGCRHRWSDRWAKQMELSLY